MAEELIRINKYLASCGICSRRDADKLIAQGRVLVDGKVPESGTKLTGNEAISVDGKMIKGAQTKKVYAFYKPVGITCTERDPHAEKVIADIVKLPFRVTYAGRLDKDSEGLLLLTNDGDLINSIMRGANRHEKEYVVKVNKPITQDAIAKLENGIFLKELDVTTRKCEIEQLGKFTFKIIITQGLNRQIRRMCEAVGLKVISLKRIRVLNVELGNLKPGEYRELTDDELAGLYGEQ